MKKIILVVVVLVAAGFIAYQIADESAPKGNSTQKAEALTDKMFEAIGKEKWDSLAYIQWSFRDRHDYLWDKKSEFAQIKWDDISVKMNLKDQSGIALKGDKALEENEKQEIMDKAWKLWCNDSFWLNAPAKARDGGTKRSIAPLEDGSDGLLVEYNSGGVTPGDAYLWALDENGLPEYYKMWVSIIPIGGIKATWSDWEDLDGIMISSTHEMGPMNVSIGNLKTGNSLEEIGVGNDFFDELK